MDNSQFKEIEDVARKSWIKYLQSREKHKEPEIEYSYWIALTAFEKGYKELRVR